MDEYLKPNSSLIRLIEEYKKYNSLVIAVDFDNTLFDYHKKGESYNNVITLLKELKQLNCEIIIFTANPDYEFITKYCGLNNILFDKINENPDFIISDARKIYYNALLDDRAGLLQVYTELSLLCKILTTK